VEDVADSSTCSSIQIQTEVLEGAVLDVLAQQAALELLVRETQAAIPYRVLRHQILMVAAVAVDMVPQDKPHQVLTTVAMVVLVSICPLGQLLHPLATPATTQAVAAVAPSLHLALLVLVVLAAVAMVDLAPVAIRKMDPQTPVVAVVDME